MSSDTDDGIEGEVVRTEVVRYFQGALGSATASLLFLSLAAGLWIAGDPGLAFVAVAGSGILSANGISIWAWDRLQEVFRTRLERRSEPSRTLNARPFSDESLVEMQSGLVMVLALIGVLGLGRLVLELLGTRVLVGLVIGALTVGNAAALALVLYSDG